MSEKALQKKRHVDDSVQAGREFVEAYVEYVHYVEGIHKAALGPVHGHSEHGVNTEAHDEH